jgi:hypothetical protein
MTPASWLRETASGRPSGTSWVFTKCTSAYFFRSNTEAWVLAHWSAFWQANQTHASVFDLKKYALVHFVNTQEVDPQYTPLSLQGHSSVTLGETRLPWQSPFPCDDRILAQGLASIPNNVQPFGPGRFNVGSLHFSYTQDLPSSSRPPNALWGIGLVLCLGSRLFPVMIEF